MAEQQLPPVLRTAFCYCEWIQRAFERLLYIRGRSFVCRVCNGDQLQAGQYFQDQIKFGERAYIRRTANVSTKDTILRM